MRLEPRKAHSLQPLLCSLLIVAMILNKDSVIYKLA